MGDFPLKNKNVVTSEPDILSFNTAKLNANFAVLATDGLWDTHSNEAVVAQVREGLSSQKNSKIGGEQLQEVAKDIALDSYGQGSTDNITVIVLKF